MVLVTWTNRIAALFHAHNNRAMMAEKNKPKQGNKVDKSESKDSKRCYMHFFVGTDEDVQDFTRTGGFVLTAIVKLLLKLLNIFAHVSEAVFHPTSFYLLLFYL